MSITTFVIVGGCLMIGPARRQAAARATGEQALLQLDPELAYIQTYHPQAVLVGSTQHGLGEGKVLIGKSFMLPGEAAPRRWMFRYSSPGGALEDVVKVGGL